MSNMIEWFALSDDYGHILGVYGKEMGHNAIRFGELVAISTGNRVAVHHCIGTTIPTVEMSISMKGARFL